MSDDDADDAEKVPRADWFAWVEATHPPNFSAWARHKRILHYAKLARDEDPVRAARAAAYEAAKREPECSDERAIEAANAAELEVRERLGIDGPLDTSRPAADLPFYPSDVRSNPEDWRANE